MLRLSIAIVFTALCFAVLPSCKKGDGGGDEFKSPENRRSFNELSGWLDDVKAGIEAGEDQTVSCAGVMSLAEPLLEEDHAEAKALAEEALEVCGHQVPLHDSALAIAEIQATIDAGDVSTMGCASARNSLEDIPEQYATGDDIVARIAEVNLLCGMEVHLAEVAQMITAGQAEIVSDPTTSVLSACSSADVYLNNIEADLAEHDRVAEVRAQILTLCGRDFPLAKLTAQLDAAEAEAAANPDAIMNMECVGARITADKFDESFAADEAVVAVLARHQGMCAR